MNTNTKAVDVFNELTIERGSAFTIGPKVDVSSYETTVVTPESHQANILKGMASTAKEVKKMLEDMGMDSNEPDFNHIFLVMYSEARNTYKETVFQTTGSYV